MQARDVEREQSAVLDDLPRDFVFAGRELAKRNFFAGADLVDQREIGRGQQAEVLAVLLVDALDIFGDHQLDAGAHLRIGRLLAAGTFAAPFAADCSDEASALYIAAADGSHRCRISDRV